MFNLKSEFSPWELIDHSAILQPVLPSTITPSFRLVLVYELLWAACHTTYVTRSTVPVIDDQLTASVDRTPATSKSPLVIEVLETIIDYLIPEYKTLDPRESVQVKLLPHFYLTSLLRIANLVTERILY